MTFSLIALAAFVLCALLAILLVPQSARAPANDDDAGPERLAA